MAETSKRPASSPPPRSSSSAEDRTIVPKRAKPDGDKDNKKPDRHENLVKGLKDWFTSDENNGWLSPDVELVYEDGSSRGFHIQAVRELTSPAVARCPLSLTLSHLNLDRGQTIVPHVDSPLQQCLGKIPDHVLSYLLLMEQKRLVSSGQKTTPWSAYIACLPEPAELTTPLFFDHDDMSHLAGTNLAKATHDKKEQLQQEWQQALSILQAENINSPTAQDFPLFLWAATIFSSRSFISTHILPSHPTFPMLFPIIDALNHSPTSKVEWDFQPQSSFTFKLLDYAALRPGDQVFNNYAPKQNDELLLSYGFALRDNPIEQFALKINMPPQLEAAAREIGALDAENMLFDMDASFLPATTTTSSDDDDDNSDVIDESPFQHAKSTPHYLRPPSHPFGRYTNRIPFFRGIPPYIIWFFWLQAMIPFGAHLSTLDFSEVQEDIVGKVLEMLAQAVAMKCEGLPVVERGENEEEEMSEKRRYAVIYRDGQARILNGIREELEGAVRRMEDRGEGWLKRECENAG